MKLNFRTFFSLLSLLFILSACNLPSKGAPLSDDGNATMMSQALESAQGTFVPQTQTAMTATMSAYSTTVTPTLTPFQPSYPIVTETPLGASHWTDPQNVFGKIYTKGNDSISFVWGKPDECVGAISVGEGFIFDNVTAVRSANGKGIQFSYKDESIGGFDVKEELPCVLVTVNIGTQRAVMP